MRKTDGGSIEVDVGLIGYGYWGPNLLRNLVAHSGFRVVGVVDSGARERAKAARLYPQLKVFEDARSFLAEAKPRAVVLATPPETHRQLAVMCLEAGADVLIEKPMALSVAECDEILAAAARHGRKVMVDHTFVYNPAVQYLANQVQNGTLGNLHYYDSVRINLGMFQAKTNVLWDLGPHDLSILDFLLKGEQPESLTCIGIKHFGKSHENLCYLHLTYSNNFVAHLHLNWLAPTKLRTVIIAGSKKMAIYDDNLAAEKVKIYDSQVVFPAATAQFDLRINYRVGDIVSPAIPAGEALAAVVSQFHDYVALDKKPWCDGEAGRRVVRLLEMAERSIAQSGATVRIASDQNLPLGARKQAA